MKPIALATYRDLPELAASDQLAVAALRARGLAAEAVRWDDPAADWRRFAAVIVRSCWDYTARLDEFLAWADRVAELTALWNPAALVRWNARKTYLRELGERGIEIVPSEWLAPGDSASLADLIEARGWDEVVIKPIVSASAVDTWRIDRARRAIGEGILDRLRRGPGAIVQPFLSEIASAGEWSFVFFAATGYSHAVYKRPRPGDFRVQLEHGGTIRRRQPPPVLLAQARAAADAIPGPWLFARVDGVEIAGRLRVMEIECIEPELFLAGDDAAAARFADAIAAVVGAGG